MTKNRNINEINTIPSEENLDLSSLTEENSFFNKLSSSDYFNSNRYYAPNTKEWTNSIYSYNKNTVKTLPIASNLVKQLTHSYFSLDPLLDGKKSKLRQKRLKRLSLNNIFVSQPEMKHTNDKVTVTVYVYNKNKKFFQYNLKNLYNGFQFNKLIRFTGMLKKISSNLSVRNLTGSIISKKGIKNITVNKKYTLESNKLAVNKVSKNKMIKDKNTILKNTAVNKNSDTKAKNLNTTSMRKTIKNNNFKTKRSDFVVKPFLSRNKKLSLLNKNTRAKISNYLNFAKITKARINIFLMKSAGVLNKTNSLDLRYKYITLLKKHNYGLTALSKYKLYTQNLCNSEFNNTDNQTVSVGYINYIDFNNNVGNSNQTTTLDNTNESFKSSYLSFIFNNNNISMKKRSLLRNTSLSNRKHIIKLNKLAKQSLKRSVGLMTKFKTFYKLFVLSNLTNKQNLLSLDNNNKTIDSSSVFNGLSVKSNNDNQALKVNSTALDSINKNRIRTIGLKSIKLLKKVRKYKNFILKVLNWDNKSFAEYENKYYKNFMQKAYAKELLCLYYIKMLSFNNMKFKSWFLLGLKKILSNIYKKKIEFNFVNLKYLHLNSDIFSQSIAMRLRKRGNKLLRVLKKALNLVKLSKINKKTYFNVKKTNQRNSLVSLYNNSINKISTMQLNTRENVTNDGLNTLLSNLFPNYSTGNLQTTDKNTTSGFVKSTSQNPLNDTQKNVLDSLKHKAVFGVRLEAAGRLSKRLTASRSVFKLRYKGSLTNIDSSNGLSSVTLRGTVKPNIQYTKISSKTRNGAFGLKGWVSSY